MKTTAFLIGVVALAFPLTAAAETWKNVSLVDTACVAKVKADPDKHSKQCAMQCRKRGYGIFTSDGTYVPFDADGNQKAYEAIKGTEKTDHIRATVTGTKDGDTIKVEKLTIE
jgi:hypothetical protein